MANGWVLNVYTESEATLTTDNGKNYEFKNIDPDELWEIVWASLLRNVQITIIKTDKE